MFVHVYEEMSDKNLQQAVKEIQFLRSNGDEMASLGLKKHILQGTGREGGGSDLNTYYHIKCYPSCWQSCDHDCRTSF